MPEELVTAIHSQTENGLLLSGSEVITQMIKAQRALGEASDKYSTPLPIIQVDGNKHCLDAMMWMNIHRLQTKRTPTVRPQQVMREQFDEHQRNEILLFARNYGF
jgi:hypothetical protein